MKILTSALVAGCLAAGAANAATVDLTDEVFVAGSLSYSFGPIVSFQEEADGVTFTFNRVFGAFRDIGPWENIIDPVNPALTLGGGGLNVSEFTLSVSEDVTLNSYNGIGPLNTGNDVSIFDVVGGSVSSVGNTFDNLGGIAGVGKDFNFVSGPLVLEAGVVYTFDVTNRSANTTAHIFSFDFTKAGTDPTDPTAPVPLPAGLPLLLAGLGALGIAKRRKA